MQFVDDAVGKAVVAYKLDHDAISPAAADGAVFIAADYATDAVVAEDGGTTGQRDVLHCANVVADDPADRRRLFLELGDMCDVH
ncbi:hypothetical protein JS73_12745 [Synergistes jonesii]|uniref:Uncharacterized protein n=1 Tax=Synergistes jonesii TaxID=2754 RepID=A0A073INB8_9BACT|nr:hypothetical protein EH55_11905 [Synergistes jonesii]OFB60260.1 hypothetical protein JS73_12745 [Synergistes jonesii]OFB65637.1 hypothetical protein JS72_01310 [Synergistes jonesii]OFB66537.1 hypothetical protein JS78_12765 [Synergistes jonesii]OFB67017.1 hypothetical protein JS77_12775 [Synergistes jonesii]